MYYRWFYGTVDFDPNVGVFNLTAAYSYDCFILKIDSSGNLVWAKSIGRSPSPGNGIGIAVDKSGNVYSTGQFGGTFDFDPGTGVFHLTSKGSDDIYVLKLDALGNFVWAKSIGSSGQDIGLSIDVDSSGNAYTSGVFQGTADFDPGVGVFNLTVSSGYDIFVSKLNSSGNFVWAKSIKNGNSGPYGFYGSGITVDDNKNAYLISPYSAASITFGATIITNKGPSDIFIAKLSNDTITDPCANITCNINPGAFATNVSNAGCNNGTIKVKRGNGVYNFYPHIELYKDANLVTFIDLSPGTLEYTFSNLIPGKYTVKVSDGLCCQITFFRNIKCRAPSSGFQASNVAAQSVDLTWNVVNCAEGYRVQFRPVGTTFWYARNTNGNTGTISITGLLPNTTYEWRVGTKCPGWPTTQNTIAYSPKSSFKTTALRVGEIITETNFTNEAVALNLFPNPATYTLTVNFEAEDEMANLKVVNTVGQVVYQKQLSATDGIYEEQLDVSNFSNGMYLLLVETANSISRKNFVKE
ncbi:MAG: T9SS type A sorting domain-containing protein [Bacteroidetes bacterium]|nr:T9SS type A sorting domain-containing protein [Bacteroidota bacterium]